MKKSIKFSTAAAVALSAITPVAVFANETTETTETVKNGFYTASGYYENFKDIPKSERKALIKSWILGGENVQDLVAVIDGKIYDVSQNVDAVLNPESTLEDLTVITYEEYLESGKELTEEGISKPGETDPGETNPGELTVESVSAINPTSVKVTFNKEVEALAKADVTVTNKDNNKVLVKSVTLAEDKKSATVEFYDALTKGDYKVAVKDAGEATLSYEIGAVASIVAETTQTFAKSASGKKVAYKFLDANGVDITSTVKVSDVTVQAVDTTLVAANGDVTTSSAKSTFAYVVYTKADGTELKSERITVKVEASKTVEITDYTVGAKTFTDSDYAQVTQVSLGATPTLLVQVKDQFGDKTSASGAKFESLDLSVAVVDASSGKVTPIKEGKFAVKITAGDVTKTVELEVVAAAKETSISTDKTEVTLSNQSTNGEVVKVEVKDQFDKAISGSVFTAAATTQAGKDLVNVAVDTVNGKITVTPKAGANAGTATIEVKSSVDATIKSTFTVKVTEAGDVNEYELKGFEAKLDKFTTNTAKTPKDMTLSVIPVDASGAQAGPAETGVTYTVKELDKDGKPTVTASATEIQTQLTSGDKVDATDATITKGKYTIEVKVGSVVIATETLEVVDTAPQPELEFTATSVSDTDYDGNVFAEVASKLKATLAEKPYTVGGTNNLTVNKVSYTTTNSAIVDTATEATAITFVKDGSVDLLVGKVSITVDSKTYVIDMNNFKLTVSSEEDAVSAGTLYISDDAVASTNPFLTTLVLTDGVQKPTTGSAIQTALVAKLASFQDSAFADTTGRDDLTNVKAYTASQIKFNAENIKISADGKRVEITGPVMSEEAFKVAKGAKLANYGTPFKISLYKDGAVANPTGSINDADKVADIVISADGSAKVVDFVATP